MQLVIGEYFGFEYSNAVRIFMVGFAGLAIVAALFIRMSLLQWILALTLFFTALTSPTTLDRTAYLATWMAPIQLRRAEGHLAMGILLTLVVILSGKLHAHRVPAQGLFMLAISLYAGMISFIHETPMYAFESIGFALATIPCMLFATSWQSSSYDGCLRLLRTIMLVSVVWTVCCSIQFVINPRMLLNTGGRFWGMLANAQQAAMLVAPFAVIATWLLINDKSRRLRLLWVGLIAINLLFLGWTGSRTGVLMLLLGMTFVLYSRLGRVVVFLPVAAVMFMGLSFLAEELQIGANLERLVSTENTRAGVWRSQMASIAESPLIGVGLHETGGSESSWLNGFAGFGVGMFLLLISFLLYSMWKCAMLLLKRRRLPKAQRPMVDMFIAWNAMYFAAATFEGIMVGRSSTSQTLMLMFAGVGVWLTEATSRAVTHEEEQWALDSSESSTELDYAYGYDDYATA